MQINDLKKSIEDMSDNELRQMLLDVRRRRETVRAKPEKQKAVSKKEAQLSALSKEQILAMLKQMGA